MNAPLPRELSEQIRPVFAARRPALLSRGGWAMTTAAVYVNFVLVPAMNLYLPASHPLHLSDYFVSLAGKIMGVPTGQDFDRLIALRARVAAWLEGEELHGTIWRAGLPKTMLALTAAR